MSALSPSLFHFVVLCKNPIEGASRCEVDTFVEKRVDNLGGCPVDEALAVQQRKDPLRFFVGQGAWVTFRSGIRDFVRDFYSLRNLDGAGAIGGRPVKGCSRKA